MFCRRAGHRPRARSAALARAVVAPRSLVVLGVVTVESRPADAFECCGPTHAGDDYISGHILNPGMESDREM